MVVNEQSMGHSTTQASPTVVRDPVCGMIVDSEKTDHAFGHDGHIYAFCSASCREKFVSDPAAYVTATDPVCGMSVNRAAAEHMATHDGERFYFCSSRCREKFEDAPETYLGDCAAQEPMPEGTLYTCPMHPEIVQEGAGDCPKCGMALEPMGVPAGDTGPNPELVDFSRRFKIGVALTVPILVLAMAPMVGLPLRDWLGGGASWRAFSQALWACWAGHSHFIAHLLLFTTAVQSMAPGR